MSERVDPLVYAVPEVAHPDPRVIVQIIIAQLRREREERLSKMQVEEEADGKAA